MENLLLSANWNQLKKGEAWVFWVLARVVALCIFWNEIKQTGVKWNGKSLLCILETSCCLQNGIDWKRSLTILTQVLVQMNANVLLSLLYILHSFARSKVMAWDFCLTLHSHSPFSILCLTARVLDLCQNTGCFAVLICLALYFSFSLKIVNFISFCNALYTGFSFYQRIKSLRKFSSHSGNGGFSDDSKEAISKKATNKGIISSCL